jgi:hypothetical protein
LQIDRRRTMSSRSRHQSVSPNSCKRQRSALVAEEKASDV